MKNSQLLTEEQIANIEGAVRRGMGGVYTRGDVQAVVDFITGAALGFAAARMILEGTMDAQVINGEVLVAPRTDTGGEVIH